MNNKLYVSNLPFTITERELSQIFAKSGTVSSARIITDRASGRSRGFGFVEMSTSDEGTVAIRNLDGTEMSGRSISVCAAKEQEPRNRFGFKDSHN